MNPPGQETGGPAWLPVAVNKGELSLLTLSPLKTRDRSASNVAGIPKAPMAAAIAGELVAKSS